MYSSRKFPPLRQQLATVASLGYSRVEYQVGAGESAADQASLANEFMLLTPTGHFDAAALLANPLSCVADAARLSAHFVVAPWLGEGERPTTLEGWSRLAGRLTEIASLLGRQGLALCWHNHDYEFERLPGGEVPMDVLLRSSPALLWQPDTGWMERASVDIADWLARYRGRIPSIHIKDVARPGQNLDEDGWADVGYGRIDWAGIVPVMQSLDAVAYIVEHDNPSDYRRFAARSLETLRTWT